MYQMLFTRLALTGSSATQVSQPVSMSGANAAQLDVVVLSYVRLQVTLTGSSPVAVIAAGLNTASL